MMTEWAYKFTTKKRSREDTTRLADAFGFLARSAYRRRKSGGAGGIVNLVARVMPDHVMHAYYLGAPVGTFRILDPDSRGERFARVWPDKGAALVRVQEVEDNRELLDMLARTPAVEEGYLPDPRLGVFTGWLVERVAGREPPAFGDIEFPPRGSLVRIAEATPRTHEIPEDELLGRVVHDPDIMGGKPCIRGTRVTVGMILGRLAVGHSFDAILADFPYLSEIDLRAALAYAAWRTQERELPLEAA